MLSIFIGIMFPFYWLVLIAFTPFSQLGNVGLIPVAVNWDVFLDVLRQTPLHIFIFNSLVIAATSTIIVLSIGSVAGYVFGRLEFPGRIYLLVGFLIISYFPGTTFLIPLFRLFTGNISLLGVSSPDLYGGPFPIILPLSGLLLPLSVYILTTFYSQIPDGIEDAARVEGDTRLGALVRVIMPLAAPGVATAGILTFIIVYNEFFFSYLMTTSSPDDWSPVVHGILSVQGLRALPFHLMAAASILGLIPIVIIVLLAQRRIVSGLTAGALKE
jgi:multiple sugar transport system permease protein